MSSTDKPFEGPGASSEGEPMAPTGATDEEEIAAARAANRFDIRRIIGGVFVVYSVILIALGIFGSHHIKNKAAGVNIDLWTGLAMLLFGALMIFWALFRPTALVRPGAIQRPPEAGGEAAT
ncbi:MAG: hypothetical protein WAL63_16905 [Solirubrobacteraceae bacterium]